MNNKLFILFFCIISFIAFLLVYIVPANAKEPIKAHVVALYDKDTIFVLADTWPDVIMKVVIRTKDFMIRWAGNTVCLYNVAFVDSPRLVVADVQLKRKAWCE